MRRGQLKLVEGEPKASPEGILREALRARDEAMADVRKLDAIIAIKLRQLATHRGVAFIRVETARRELLG